MIHRDLKPANVRVTPEGKVKVLDFGLAKPIRSKPGREGTSAAESDSFVVTEEGRVLGTPMYMSPEQARGKPVDRRTDVWAFGCVLFECLTGKRAFGGDSFTDIVAAIVGQEPDWDALPPLAPRVKELLRRCLTKDPRARLRDAGEARVQLQLALGEPGRGAESTAMLSTSNAGARRTRSTAFIAGALGLAAGGALVYGLRPARSDAVAIPAVATPLHFEFEELPSGSAGVDIAISPDGATVACTNAAGLHVRSLGSLVGKILVAPGVGEGARQSAPSRVSWSPDSREIAYVADENLWRIPITGGAPTRVSDASLGVFAWTANDQLLVFDSESKSFGTIPVQGGKFVTQLTVDPKTTSHYDGVVPLPDGSMLVVRHRHKTAFADVLSFAWDGELRDLVQLTDWQIDEIDYWAGHIVIARSEGGQKSRWKVGFSLERGEIQGEPTLLTDGASPCSIAADGTLAYQRVEGERAMESVWVDMRGVIEPFGRKHVGVGDMLPALSTNGRRVFTTVYGSDHTIWAYDLDRGVTTAVVKPKEMTLATRVTLADGRVLGWTMEDVTVAFPLDGQGEPETITKGALASISRDRVFGLLVFGAMTDDLRLEVLQLADGVVTPFRNANVNGHMLPTISPNGRFALYGSERTGDKQIYLAAFPSGNGDWQVSTDGAVAAWFSEGGDTIYLARGGFTVGAPAEVWSVAFQSEPEVRLGAPQLLFTLEGEEVRLTGYHPTQERFIGTRRVSSGASSIALYSGWANPR